MLTIIIQAECHNLVHCGNCRFAESRGVVLISMEALSFEQKKDDEERKKRQKSVLTCLNRTFPFIWPVSLPMKNFLKNKCKKRGTL